MIRYRYSRWDGTQQVFQPDEDELIAEISDEILAYGDLESALDRLLQKGMQGKTGDRLKGIQELLKRLREMRQQILEQYNLNSVMDDIRQKLNQVIQTERQGIQQRLEEARGSPQADLAKVLEDVASKKLSFLDNLPKELGGAIKELSQYEFMDQEARRLFQELMAMLQRSILESHFRDLSQQLQSLTPEDLAHLKEMVNQLNRMLEERLRGKEPDFENFMKEFGQYFPNNHSSLEELAEDLQQRLAQMQSLLESLPLDMRQSLEHLADSLLRDQGLRDELTQLSTNLERLLPFRRPRRRYPFTGDEPLSLTQALEIMENLQAIDELERQLRESRVNLDNVDPRRFRELLGDEAYQNLQTLQRLTDILEEAGYIQRKGNRYELTPRAIRKIGEKALRDIFEHLRKDRLGHHETSRYRAQGNPAEDTKPYEFGDPFLFHLERTLMNALQREGPGTPVQLQPDDFEVYKTEPLVQSATVLMLDMSWSMPMRGNFLAAKKVVLALDCLIRTQFPRDHLYIVGFSDYARQLKSEDLPQLTWNEFVYGTNMQHGFMLAHQLLSRHKEGTRQIIMISDGEPTAHMEGGRAFFDYPPSYRTLQETLLEAKRCGRKGIVINTFMLAKNPHLVQFVEKLTKLNRGRAFFTSADQLGRYVVVDYITNKRRGIKP